MPASVYAIAGGKGGVGKTTTAANLAATLRATGRDVVLVDADLAMSNMQDTIGLDSQPTVHDVLAGSASLGAAIVEESTEALDVPGTLDVLPGSAELDAFATADPEGLTEIVDDLAREYDAIVLDTASGVTRETAVPISIADETIVVSTPAKASLLDAEKTVEFVEQSGGTVAGLVVSRVCAGPDSEEISEAMDVDLLASVPDLDAPGTDPLRPYRTLVVRLLIGKDVATDPADVLDIADGDTPRITSTLEPSPATPDAPADTEAESSADDAAPVTVEAVEDEKAEGESGRLDRFVNAISRP
jgi:septum site-determining protein MinD